MGVTVRGLDEWIRDLEEVPAKAPKEYRAVMSRGGVQMKLMWKEDWKRISHIGHIPHLIRAIGYDLSLKGGTHTVTVGAQVGMLQSGLAAYIEFGTLTSAPHPAGQKALDAELPKLMAAVEKVTEDLFNGSS